MTTPSQTFLPVGRTPTTDEVLPSRGIPLTEEQLERIRNRVRRLAAFFAGLGVFGIVLSSGFVVVGRDPTSATLSALAHVAIGGVALFTWRAARTPRVSHITVLNLGLVLEVVACLGASWGGHQWGLRESGALLFMTWSTPFIVLFPVLIPCPPRRMLVASIVAASMEWAAVLILELQGFDALAEVHPGLVINPTLAVVFAYFASRVIYGLNVDVAKAKQMGSYCLETRLGQGGMGEVWRAEHCMLARPAAIKLIRPDSLGTGGDGGQTLLERFEREAQATSSLRSPHTVEVYDFGRAGDGTFYYVMELLDGVDLDTLVKRFGPLPPARVVHVLRQACHSLTEAHARGLIHRDIKPANLFLCRYGMDTDFVKVLDFGLVKTYRTADAARADLTHHGTAVGTPSFMAPEMALGDGVVDGRADLYALGCVAYWLLTGAFVFEGTSAMDVIVRHARDVPDPPSARSEVKIPSELEAVVMDCLAKDPTARPPSAQALSHRLAALRFEEPWTEERAAAWWERHLPALPGEAPSAEGGVG